MVKHIETRRVVNDAKMLFKEVRPCCKSSVEAYEKVGELVHLGASTIKQMVRGCGHYAEPKEKYSKRNIERELA